MGSPSSLDLAFLSQYEKMNDFPLLSFRFVPGFFPQGVTLFQALSVIPLLVL